MKGNELIEKILNNEIKSGTLIKMKSNYPALEWEKTLCFNGNWFSEEKYYPGVPRYDDIILHLCSEYMTFEILEDTPKEEKKIPEKICTNRIINTKDISEFEMIQNKINAEYTYAINEIIDFLKSKGDE